MATTQWYLLAVDASKKQKIGRNLLATGIAIANPAADPVVGGDLLFDHLFISCDEAHMSHLLEEEGVVGLVRNNAGRALDIPSAVVAALVGEAEDLGRISARIAAANCFYRLDALLAEIGRVKTEEFRGAQGQAHAHAGQEG